MIAIAAFAGDRLSVRAGERSSATRHSGRDGLADHSGGFFRLSCNGIPSSAG